ncbi:MAG: LytR C-terminal domain-containing protein [Thermoleophilia bacterium]
MPAPKKGYRVDRLRRRRRRMAERWQAWVLYVLAALVAFAAVLGAWYVTARLLGDEDLPRTKGYLALISLAPEAGARPVAAALIVKDAAADGASLYVIPPEFLVSGPHGEYVFAADALAAGTIGEDLERVIDARLDASYRLPAAALAGLAAADVLQISLDESVTLPLGGARRTFEDGDTVAARELPGLFTAATPDDGGAARLQVALWRAVLEAAALRPRAVRDRAVTAAAAGARVAASPADTWYLADALRELAAGDFEVDLMPATTRVAEGQFAYVPDPEGIMARITRKAPGFRGQFTVLVRNGSGKVGVGEAVAARLAALDVDLPAPVNADSFDYRQTRILAGRDALPVAQDIRAILGRGVVLDGAQLPPDTVVVIVGGDLEANDVEPKDQP